MNMEYNFEVLKIPKPPLFDNYNKCTKDKIYEYLSKLDEHNQKIYIIAHNHLETSFNLAKSNGFINWLKEQDN
jgi:hypothetical protein